MNTVYLLLLEAERAVDRMREPIEVARDHLTKLREDVQLAARGNNDVRARLRCLDIQNNVTLLSFTMDTDPSDDTAAAAAPEPRPRS